LSIESPRRLLCGYVSFTFIQQLHIAAQRKDRDHVLHGILPVGALPDRGAEADGKAQHANTQFARHPEVTELVHGDEHANRNNERRDGNQIFNNTVR
jgi:hypothetical protein